MRNATEESKTSRIPVRRSLLGIPLAGAILLVILGLVSGPVSGAEDMSADADEILRSMCSYMKGLGAFRVKADIDNEVITQEGQKLQFCGSAELLMKRPAGFKVSRKGMFADVEMIFDGKVLTIHGKRHNLYTQFEVPGNNDDAIHAVEFETGLDTPGADLLFSDPYAILSAGVMKGEYFGTAFVNGVECYHLAFREEKVDWQLWVQTGERPLPMKYVITSKWQTGAPQYAATLRDWDTDPKIAEGAFQFTASEEDRKLDSLPVNEMGEVEITVEGQ